MSREKWLQERRSSIGASESAGILGVSPWASPLSVWAAKVLGADDEESIRLEVGSLLEDDVVELYARHRGVGVKPWPQDQMVRHPDWERTRMACTPDAIDDEGRLVEAKTVEWFMGVDWRDGAPLHYRIQAQHQMACTGRDVVAIPHLISMSQFDWIDEPRNDDFIFALETACGRFWREFVEPKIQPSVTGCDADTRALVRLHPNDSGETIILADDFADLDERLEQISEQLKTLSDEEKNIKNRIKAALGGATFGEVPGRPGRWAWKSQDRKAYTVAASTIRVLRRLKK